MSKFRAAFELFTSGSVALVALIMLGIFISERGGRRSDVVMLGPPIEGWSEKNELGIRQGPNDAALVVTTFLDFKCPFCRNVAIVLDSLKQEYPQEVAVVVQHFPLGPGVSSTAAVAAECAARQGLFWRMHDALFAKADSLGGRNWEGFARDAGLPDLPAFSDCLELPTDSFPRIVGGLEVGTATDVTGTPTIWVNGGRFRGRRLPDFREVLEELLPEDPVEN